MLNKKIQPLSAFKFKEGNCIVNNYWSYIKLAIREKLNHGLFIKLP